MTNREQKIDKIKKVSLIIQVLPESNSIRDIHKKTNISESTIQKILHNPELIAQALELNNDTETIEQIKQNINEWFKKNKKEGFKRGAAICHGMLTKHPSLKKK